MHFVPLFKEYVLIFKLPKASCDLTLCYTFRAYYWEKGKNTFYDKVASKLELRILAGRGFAGNKEYKQIVVDLLKNIYTDAENLNYD